MSLRVILLFILLGFVNQANAETYPAKPIHIIVPFAPGGGGDFVARLVGQKMTESWGQQVIVENRPGVGGSIAAQYVAKSPPDGYTLLLAASSLVINPHVYKDTPYDAIADFAPITETTLLPNFLVVHPSLPVKTVSELIALAKLQPEKIVFGSTGFGTGPHLAGEMLNLQAGINMLHVPYGRGGGSMIADLLSGRVAFTFASLPTVVAYIKEGQLRPLGVSSEKRWPLMPEVPTIAESGFPGFEMSTWMGLVAPAGTPNDIVNKLYVEVTRILNQPDVRERSYAVGAEPVANNTPAQFSEFIKSESAKYADLVKRSGMSMQ